MTDSNALVAFVRARLDEDALTIRESVDHLLDGGRLGLDIATLPGPTRHYISRWLPVRMEREVEAKRRTSHRHQRVVLTYWPDAMCGTCPDHDAEPRPDPLGADGTWRPNERWPCWELRNLASVWSDHPDYDPTWRVDG